MINEYGSWPPSRHSSSAHSIRLPLVLPSLCGIMAWSACAALHTRNVPAAEYEAQYACLSRCNRMPSWKTISSSPHSPFSAGSFATKEQPHAAGRRRAVPIHWSNIVRLSSILSRSCSLGPSKTSWPFCCSCSIWSLMRSLSLSTEASIML